MVKSWIIQQHSQENILFFFLFIFLCPDSLSWTENQRDLNHDGLCCWLNTINLPKTRQQGSTSANDVEHRTARALKWFITMTWTTSKMSKCQQREGSKTDEEWTHVATGFSVKCLFYYHVSEWYKSRVWTLEIKRSAVHSYRRPA